MGEHMKQLVDVVVWCVCGLFCGLCGMCGPVVLFSMNLVCVVCVWYMCVWCVFGTCVCVCMVSVLFVVQC